MISMTINTLIHTRGTNNKNNEKEETVELLEKKETPQEEYQTLKKLKKKHLVIKYLSSGFRISPESLALIYMSDENKKMLIN